MPPRDPSARDRSGRITITFDVLPGVHSWIKRQAEAADLAPATWVRLHFTDLTAKDRRRSSPDSTDA